MQALILAAGMGRRLGNITADKTKAMVEVNGKTLIERTLEAILGAGIKRVVVITGHGADGLQTFVNTFQDRLEIVFVHNPLYETTNNIYSLWLAREYLEADDTILLESDLIFDPEILQEVVSSPAPNLTVVAKFERWMDGTVTLLSGENIVDVIPKKHFKWSDSESYFKTVNIYKFSRQFARRFCVPFLSAYMSAFGRTQYYEEVLTVITALEKTELKAFRVETRKWYEIDDANDLAIAEILFANGDSHLRQYQRLYGGYWRFPQLLDFCYLVNPYFPSRRMVDEFKASLSTLLASYPSGLDVQNTLAARRFDCRPSQVLVGNGASELIKAMLQHTRGEIGVILPTFEEYLKCAGPAASVRKLKPDNVDFSCSVAQIERFSQGLTCLVVVNPDNPTGRMLDRSALTGLIESLGKRGVCVIVDESFADFASAGFSLLNGDFLDAHPWVAVIKSISKSYGIPGLRLGVLACADENLIRSVREKLAIWNINSFGEFFLQILGKYEDEYQRACAALRAERDRFGLRLMELNWLRVVPSEANYFLCQVSRGLSATALTGYLLEQHQMLIKDCTGKAGLEDAEYVRIAIRSEADNERLLAALTALKN